MTNCVFCRIVAGDEPAEILHRWYDAIAITPLNPVVEGHVLIIPTRHMADFTTPNAHGWSRTAVRQAFDRAAEYAAHNMGPCNLITSKGAEATQTVFHFHAHLIPRREGDGLQLPWSVTS